MSHTVLSVPPSVPISLEYDHINDRVIWSDGIKKTIRSVYRNNTRASEVSMGTGW